MLLDRHFRYRRLILGALLVIVTVVVTSLTSGDRGATTGLENLVNDVVLPAQALAFRVSQALRSVGAWFSDVRTLRRENEELKKRIAEMDYVRVQLEEALSENRRLRELVGFIEESGFSFIPAAVVGRNPDNWFSALVLDRGSRHGVVRDSPVVSSKGLVGRTTKVTERTSTVMLLLDPDSSVGVIVERSRDAGIVFGGRGDGRVKMTMFSRDADVREGDLVVTSGLGSVFPKGILVGYVERVEREDYGLTKSALVRPAGDFGRMEEVLIVRRPAEERPR
ncbi:MAG: rod shape-determining protein MreC [Firmicutes bacterium]|jgi:rod shape-determining protein MreC|nr:rod shape-determining protein MreC [Bacillota bacterium]